MHSLFPENACVTHSRFNDDHGLVVFGPTHAAKKVLDSIFSFTGVSELKVEELSVVVLYEQMNRINFRLAVPIKL